MRSRIAVRAIRDLIDSRISRIFSAFWGVERYTWEDLGVTKLCDWSIHDTGQSQCLLTPPIPEITRHTWHFVCKAVSC
ncbi:hypothetical protein Y032_0018g3527 [Ancylostoma ceylanicum]|uniref:Uncharacterized protein n=1 Tax=Ancylostoma ceylanicum TaxID=53326 RepID=A0A016V440_9BILA|nr:hypothetical protein Y032_0018g3527 [Ancylostoma ceylanicum]